MTSKPKGIGIWWRDDHFSPISTSRTSKWWSAPGLMLNLVWVNTNRWSLTRDSKILRRLQYVQPKWQINVRFIAIWSKQVWKLLLFKFRIVRRKMVQLTSTSQKLLYYRIYRCIWTIITKWEACLLIHMAGSTTPNLKMLTLGSSPSWARKRMKGLFHTVCSNLTMHLPLHLLRCRGSNFFICRRWHWLRWLTLINRRYNFRQTRETQTWGTRTMTNIRQSVRPLSIRRRLKPTKTEIWLRLRKRRQHSATSNLPEQHMRW